MSVKKVVDAFITAFSTADGVGLRALFTTDATWRVIPIVDSQILARDAVPLWESMVTTLQGFGFTTSNIVISEDGGQAVVEGMSFGTIPNAAKERYEQELIMSLDVVEGKIRAVREYITNLEGAAKLRECVEARK